MRLWVKDREAGKVIGRGGETVREVMEKPPGTALLLPAFNEVVTGLGMLG